MQFIPNSNIEIKSNTNESLWLPTQHQNPVGGRFLSRDNSNNSNNNNNIIIGRENVNSKDEGDDRYRWVVEFELKMEYTLALAKIKTKIMRAALVREQNASKLRMASHAQAHYDDNNEKKRGGRDGVDDGARNDGCRSRSGRKRMATEISCARRKKWQQDQQQQQEQKKKAIVAIAPATATATAIGKNMEGVHHINNSSDASIENSTSSSSSSNNEDTSSNLNADTMDGTTTVTPVVTKTMGNRTRREDATPSVGAAAASVVVVGQSYDHHNSINDEGDGDNNADWREMGEEYYHRADDCLLF